MPVVAEHRFLDARGLQCPMPILKAAKEMKSLEEGEILEVLTTDLGALADFPAWAEDTGNEIVEQGEQDGVLTFFIRKGPDEH